MPGGRSHSGSTTHRAAYSAAATRTPWSGSAAISAATVCPSTGCTHPGATSASGISTNRRWCARGCGRIGIGRLAHQPAHGDDIQVERPRRIRRRAPPPSLSLQRLQGRQQTRRLDRAGQMRHGIDVVGLARRRHRRRAIPARQPTHAHPRQRIQRGHGGATGREQAVHRPVPAGWRRFPPGSRGCPLAENDGMMLQSTLPTRGVCPAKVKFGSACIVHRKVHRMHFLPTERVALFYRRCQSLFRLPQSWLRRGLPQPSGIFPQAGARDPRLLLLRRAGDRGLLATEAADRLAGL